MTALLGVGADDAQALCDEVRGDDVLLVANENSPAQVVSSGSVAAIERPRRWPRSGRRGPCGCPSPGRSTRALMRPAVEAGPRRCSGGSSSRDPAFPIAENVTGDARR